MSTFIKISSTTLSTATTTITIDSIPQTFRDLKLIVSGRSSTAANLTDFSFTVNNNSDANIDIVRGLGFANGGSATLSNSSSGGEAQFRLLVIPGSDNTVGHFGYTEIYFSEYAQTTHEKLVSAKSTIGGVSFYNLSHLGSVKKATTAISRIDITTSSSFAVGSTFLLYGIGE